MLRGRIFNIQRYSVQDGPGIRTTVFFKGCPLHCPWCHNPEGIDHNRQLVLLASRCLTCGHCREACPLTDAQGNPDPVPVGQEHCTLCGGCTAACPADAREILGRDWGVDELLSTLLADRIFFEDSGGGITFSGGEPFQQPEFLHALLIASRRHDVHTAVDTSGAVDTRHLLEAVKRVDLFLYDLKLMDDTRHRELTGASNRMILENLRVLARLGASVWIRIPLIPGINDSATELDALASFIADLPERYPVHLLPYHKTALHKFERLGLPYAFGDLETPTTAAVEQAAHVFRHRGLEACVGR